MAPEKINFQIRMFNLKIRRFVHKSTILFRIYKYPNFSTNFNFSHRIFLLFSFMPTLENLKFILKINIDVYLTYLPSKVYFIWINKYNLQKKEKLRDLA